MMPGRTWRPATSMTRAGLSGGSGTQDGGDAPVPDEDVPSDDTLLENDGAAGEQQAFGFHRGV